MTSGRLMNMNIKVLYLPKNSYNPKTNFWLRPWTDMDTKRATTKCAATRWSVSLAEFLVSVRYVRFMWDIYMRFTDLWVPRVWGRQTAAESHGILSCVRRALYQYQGSWPHVAACVEPWGNSQFLPVAAGRSGSPTGSPPIARVRSINHQMYTVSQKNSGNLWYVQITPTNLDQY